MNLQNFLIENRKAVLVVAALIDLTLVGCALAYFLD